MLAAVRTATLLGIDGHPVAVEVHVAQGLPGFTVVGLPDAACRESRERVRAALQSSELPWPPTRITVNLAPAGLRKAGAGLEVAIALGMLVAQGGLPAGALDDTGVLGELGLDGSVRAVPGTLALVDALARSGVTRVVVPIDGVHEAALVPGIEVYPARHLAELHLCLKAELPWPEPPPPPDPAADEPDDQLDLAEVRGLPQARLALATAAAGGHHVLLVGPPGVGKTMLARRLATILPDLERDEALQVTRIHSAAGLGPGRGLVTARPFRAPHHSASMAAIVGGGHPRPRPGEITLAHCGALFLDELAEFPRPALEALRQPLEERIVRISRASIALDFPADFVLVACCNPCACGRAAAQCRCGEAQLVRYRRRLSAPLLDRFDLRLAVSPPEPSDPPGPSSAEVRAQVDAAVHRQRRRYAGSRWRRNAQVPAGALDRVIPLDPGPASLWRALQEERRLTGRGAARIRRVARTLADLDGRDTVDDGDLLTAADLRMEVC